MVVTNTGRASQVRSRQADEVSPGTERPKASARPLEQRDAFTREAGRTPAPLPSAPTAAPVGPTTLPVEGPLAELLASIPSNAAAAGQPAAGPLTQRARKLAARQRRYGPRLQLGDRGKAVRTLEMRLKQRGLFRSSPDGIFDAQTRAAVQRLERSMGWNDNGIVGNRIWRHLGGVEAPAKGKDSFKTVNINIKNNPEMPQDKVVHDVRKAAKMGDLIGWNEIGPDRYAQAIKDLGPEWGHYFPKDGKLRIPNPISWKKEVWEKKGEGFLKTHGGKAKVSPNRYITWVKLKHRATGQTVVRLNTHLVSGAWSDPKPTTPWRREQWNTHMEKMERLVERFKAQGHAVVVGGDFNRDSYRVLGNQVAYDNKLNEGTHGRSTLDYIMHARDKDIRTVRARVRRGFASDHDAVVVRYALRDK